MLNHNQSDVARCRQQIEQECEAMQQAMTGFSSVAAHSIINQRYANIEMSRQALEMLIGADEAANIMTDAYIRKMG